MNLLKTEFSPLVADKEVREMCSYWFGRKQTCILWTACLGRVHMEGNVGRLLHPRTVSSWQVAGKQGPQSYNYKEVHSANDWWAWKRTLSPDENQSPSQHLHFSPVRPWAENQVMPGLLTFRNYGWIHECYFKPLFAVIYYTAVETNTT